MLFDPFVFLPFCCVPCVRRVGCAALALSFAFVSHSDGRTRTGTLIAWHSAQTNTSGHRSEERERERDADNIDDGGDNEQSERDASSYGTDDDRRIGWKEGRKEGRKALEAWKEDGRGRCQI